MTVAPMSYHTLTTVTAAFLLVVSSPRQDMQQAVSTIIAKIQRADFEADRPALRRLRAELTPFIEIPDIASRVLYCRGFALSRSAMNGVNDAADREEIEADLTQCIVEFRDAVARDPAFVDASWSGRMSG